MRHGKNKGALGSRYWRDRAEEARARGPQLRDKRDKVAKAALLRVASYDRLADLAAKKERLLVRRVNTRAAAARGISAISAVGRDPRNYRRPVI